MRRLIQIIKPLIASALYYSGLLHLYKAYRLRNRAVVITYHRVLDRAAARQSFSHDAIMVSPTVFANHLRLLKRHFNILSVHEFVHCLVSGKPLPSSSCVITFDDGWVDNYVQAFPVLRRYDLPAVIFLATDYIGSTRGGFWQEQLAAALHEALSGDRGGLEHLIEPDDLARLRAATGEHRHQLIKSYVSRQKTVPYAKVDALLQNLRKDSEHKEKNAVDRFMDWHQVDEMASNGIAFGSHAMSHRILPRLEDAAIHAELTQSRTVIESRTATNIVSLAYPNGDFDERTLDAARKAGYQVCFATERGYVDARTNPHAVPRINIHNGNAMNPSMFMATLLNIF